MPHHHYNRIKSIPLISGIFYTSHFHRKTYAGLTKVNKHVVSDCKTTICKVSAGPEIVQYLAEVNKIKPGSAFIRYFLLITYPLLLIYQPFKLILRRLC